MSLYETMLPFNPLDERRVFVPEVAPEEIGGLGERYQALVLLDVREAAEAASEGRIPGSIASPREPLEPDIGRLIPDKATPVVVYCNDGSRSLPLAHRMGRLGYWNVASLAGGFRRWAGLGLAVDRPDVLSSTDRIRYSRHLRIPEVGETGQLRLRDAHVLIVGAGGVGSPAALYLAAAGIGTLGILDFDKVDETNLQRQVLHRADRVGVPKAHSARETLLALNPGIRVEAFETRLDRRNAEELFEGFDLIIDGSDNFPTRYVVNDAAIATGKPVVLGSVGPFEGHVTVLDPPRGPCYRCLFPEPPPAERVGSSCEEGVLGVVPGVIGLLAATEAVKLLLGLGEPLVGRLLVYDALGTLFRRLNVRRDPACSVCGAG